MALGIDTRIAIETALADDRAAKELIDQINKSAAVSTGAQQAAITMNTVTATSGSLPTQDGTTVIANTATPTVVELLDLVMELRAKVVAINTALHNVGITA